MTYNRVNPVMWDDEAFVDLNDLERTVWALLLTGPQVTSLPGIQRGGVASLAESLRRPTTVVESAIAELSRRGMIEIDTKRRIICVPKAPKHNPAESANHIKAWWKRWNEVPNCPIKFKHIENLKAHACLGEPSHAKAWEETFGRVIIPAEDPSDRATPIPTPTPPEGLPPSLPNSASASASASETATADARAVAREEPPSPQKSEVIEQGMPSSLKDFGRLPVQASCTTVEIPKPPDHDAILDALLRSGNGKIDIRGPAQLKAKFIAVVHEAGWTLEELEMLGRFVAAGKITWSNRTRFDLGWFLGQDGSGNRLAELMSQAIEWDAERRLLEADRERARVRDSKPWTGDTETMREIRRQLAEDGLLEEALAEASKGGPLH